MAAFSPAPIAFKYVPNLVNLNKMNPIIKTTAVQTIFKVVLSRLISSGAPPTGASVVRYFMKPLNRNIVQIVTMKDFIFLFT